MCFPPAMATIDLLFGTKLIGCGEYSSGNNRGRLSVPKKSSACCVNGSRGQLLRPPRQRLFLASAELIIGQK